MRFMVLMWANRKGTFVQNFVLRKVLLMHRVQFPCLLHQCFAREQQDILTDILVLLLRRTEHCQSCLQTAISALT